MRVKWSPQLKDAVARKLDKGMPVTEAVVTYGINRQTLWRWLFDYLRRKREGSEYEL